MPELDDSQSNPPTEVEKKPSGTRLEDTAKGKSEDAFESETPPPVVDQIPNYEPDPEPGQDPASGSGSENKETLEETLKHCAKSISDQLDSTFMAFLEIGKILRAAAEAFKSDHKTMKEFDLWVAKSCAFGKVTASKYRRMSVLFHEKYPKILEEVRMPYLRELDFTIAYDVFSAWEAKEKGNSTGKKAKTAGKLAELKWSSDGIFVRYDGEADYTDIQSLTTRNQKKKSNSTASKGAGKTPEEMDNQAPLSKSGTESSTDVGVPFAHAEKDTELRRQYVQLRKRHEKAIKQHKRRESELRQKLETVEQHEKAVTAELELLRAQLSSERHAA